MNPLRLKIGASLVVLFALGVATGYVLGRRPVPAPHAVAVTGTPAVSTDTTNSAVTATARTWTQQRIEELKSQLNPTPEQLTAIEGHFVSLGEDYQNMRMETRARMGEAIAKMNKAIAAELTPAQRRLFWQEIRERTQRSSE